MTTIRANEWHRLDVSAVGSWEPTLAVTVVIPTRDGGRRLELLLASLGRQTYPTSLLDIVVVDDASSPPLELVLDVNGVTVRTVRCEDDGTFGAGRARNAGAAVAEGDVIVFLDSDLLLADDAVEGLARWQHAAPYSVVTATLGFFDVGDVEESELRSAIAAATLPALLKDKATDDQIWREKTFSRTFDLTVDTPDMFRIVIGAVMVVSRSLHESLGGLRELGLRGIEDTEYGYRAHAAGALLVLDRDARLWHQGRRHFDSKKAVATRRERLPLLHDLIASPGFREESTSPPKVPTLVVDLRGSDPADAVLAVLASSGPDVRCLVDQCGKFADDRVVDISTMNERDLAASAYRGWIADSVAIDSGAFEAICERMRQERIGVVHLVDAGGIELMTVASSRSLGRARLLGAADADEIILAGKTFGEWWLPAEDFGVRTGGI